MHRVDPTERTTHALRDHPHPPNPRRRPPRSSNAHQASAHQRNLSINHDPRPASPWRSPTPVSTALPRRRHRAQRRTAPCVSGVRYHPQHRHLTKPPRHFPCLQKTSDGFTSGVCVCACVHVRADTNQPPTHPPSTHQQPNPPTPNAPPAWLWTTILPPFIPFRPQ